MIYVCHKTPSHEKLYTDYLRKYLPSELQIVTYTSKQVAKNGRHKFYPGSHTNDAMWSNAMLVKYGAYRHAIKRYWGRRIICGDVDIQFFRPVAVELEGLLEGYDILFQSRHGRDDGYPCTGFAIMHCNQSVLWLYEEVLRMLRSGETNCDQPGTTVALHEERIKGLKWGLLPRNYWCPVSYRQHGIDIAPPLDLRIHHATCALGVDQKLRQLKIIREQVESWPFRVL